MLGYASAVITLVAYAHRFDDDLDVVAGRLQNAAEAASVGLAWSKIALPVDRFPPHDFDASGHVPFGWNLN